jgi:hypothetical protein
MVKLYVFVDYTYILFESSQLMMHLQYDLLLISSAEFNLESGTI